MITRAEKLNRLAARTKLLRRRGVVLTLRDLEDFLRLLDDAREATFVNPYLMATSLAPFDEKVDE